MEGYNFWADLFSTVRSMADWVKALWIVMWSLFWLGVVALVLRYWLALARFTAPPTGRPANDDGARAARFRRVFMDRG
tara:strand:- start:251 stop:484 length:234 start_codon:yes stop_codon:yes gene_type:complete